MKPLLLMSYLLVLIRLPRLSYSFSSTMFAFVGHEKLVALNASGRVYCLDSFVLHAVMQKTERTNKSLNI